MLIQLKADGASDPVATRYNQTDFKISIFIIVKDGFDGTCDIEYSPNGEDWFKHEDLKDIAADTVSNAFFQAPYLRAVAAGMSTGYVEVHMFGSL